jgi:hypothetical protein
VVPVSRPTISATILKIGTTSLAVLSETGTERWRLRPKRGAPSAPWRTTPGPGRLNEAVVTVRLHRGRRPPNELPRDAGEIRLAPGRRALSLLLQCR